MGTETKLEETGEKGLGIQDSPASQKDDSVVSSLEAPDPSEETATTPLTRKLLWKLDTR